MLFEKYDHKLIEPEILKFWEENQIVEKLRKRNSTGKKFYFLEGPPYTSGRVHIGTAWQTSMKDIILRYKRSLNFDVWDRMGYDMHGLPTEQKVMKKFNLNNKEEIEKFGLAKFTKECFIWCQDMMQQMNKDFQRLGITLDYSNPYQPITNNYMEAEWFLIKQAHDKGRLYQGLRTMHWDAATQTAVAKHEIEYQKIKDTSIYVKFQDKDNSSKYYVVWTTTPWTIPLNLAVMVNPEVTYCDVKVGSELWVLAKDLIETVMEKAEIENYSIKEEYKGKKLVRKKYLHPLKVKEYFPEELQNNPNLFTILESKEYVDTSAGTGLVHCAPGCGPEDYEVGHKNGIPPFNCVNEKGFFENFGEYSGWQAKTDDGKFIDSIEQNEALLTKEDYTHDYPYGERSHQPVIFRTTKQWFFKTEDLKPKMLKANETINWIPKTAKIAFNNWLENLRDNSITKQRYWGTAVPIWQAEENDYIVVGSLKELEQLSGQKVTNMHIPEIDKIIIKKEGKTYKRIPDVLDVWIDAGTASWNCLDYPVNQENFQRYFPADFILEGKDQIRGWFNLLMVASFLAFDKPSFKNVYMNGFLTDVNGVKMSKSLGNIITPDELIEKHGADVLRFYMFRTNAGEDINFSWEECKLKERQLHILWNIQKLLINLSKENNVNVKELKPKNLDTTERYILSKLNSTLKQVSELLENYKLDEIIEPIENLFLELSRTYIQMVRDKSSLGSNEEKATVVHTIYTVLLETIKIFQLVSPFISEAIYLNLKEEFKLEEESISHFKWSEINEKLIDKKLENSMGITLDLITTSLNAREKAKRGLRWPVQEIIIISNDKNVKKAVKDMQNILMTQTNSKSFVVKEFLDGVNVSITPNPGKIGPAYGALSPKVIQLINKNSDKIIESLKEGYETNINGNKIKITKEMLNISRTIPAGYVDAESSLGVVYLSKESSEELELEGFSRELTRNVQQARKNSGLQKTDSIILHVKTDKNLTKWLDEIKEKVGASKLTISNENSNGKNNQSFKIKDQEFSIWFSKE
jgi:isoleucyl-tRNA synthetase